MSPLLAAVVVLGGCTSPPGEPDGDPDETEPLDPEFAEILAFMEDELDAAGVVGGAIAIVRDGHLEWAAGVGLRSADADDPVTSDTLFNIASASKQFTAATAMSVVDEGRLDLDAPIGQYFTDFGLAEGYDPEGVTTRRLLTHTAAYPGSWVGTPASGRSLRDIFANNADQPLLVAPGAVWNYSNLGFSLASLVVQEAGETGSFAELAEERIFAPAGMETATYDVDEVAQGDFSYGHVDTGKGLETWGPEYYSGELYWGQGGVWASAEDLGHWAEVLVGGGGGLSSAAHQELLSPQVATSQYPGLHYGLGLFVTDGYSPTVVGHGGDNYGFHTSFEVVPDVGFGVAVMVNGDGYYPDTIASIALDRFVRLNWTAGSADFDPELLAGTYFDPVTFGTLEVQVEGDTVTVRPEGGAEQILERYYGDVYEMYLEEYGAYSTATFWRDEEGRGEFLVTRVGVGERVD